MKDVIELAKQVGNCAFKTDGGRLYFSFTPEELELYTALVRNASLTGAIDKARIFSLGLPIAQNERLIKALESLKEPTP